MVGRYSLNFGAMCNSSTVWCWRGAGDMNPYLKEGHRVTASSGAGAGVHWLLPHWRLSPSAHPMLQTQGGSAGFISDLRAFQAAGFPLQTLFSFLDGCRE